MSIYPWTAPGSPDSIAQYEAGVPATGWKEARAASALDHANIGTVYGVEDTNDGRLCIVMAFYDGENLARKLRHGPLTSEKAINIGCQVARGLHHAHQHSDGYQTKDEER